MAEARRAAVRTSQTCGAIAEERRGMPVKKALGRLLAQLPECSCDLDAFCKGAEYFNVTGESAERAAEELPMNHQLQYKGVRELLSACIEEFSGLFVDDGFAHCEVTVPAPPFAVYALQNVCRSIHFSSGAFFAQIVLRGILLHHEPLDFSSCSKRHCGLNQMRIRLLRTPPISAPEYQLQFGVLCDSCVKTGEYAPAATKTLSVTFPTKQRSSRQIAADFYHSVYESMNVFPNCENIKDAFKAYGRMMKATNRITELCTRPDREPLWGNSFSLAQSVQLLSSEHMDRFIGALETLAEEMENAPKSSTEKKRIYCYYIPFLQPDIDRIFRENGAVLVGNAAFLQSGKYIGLDLAGMTEAWLDNMANRAEPEKQCAAIAEAMAAQNSSFYLTGAFGFDRRLGSIVPLQRRILQRYNIETGVLDTDFWCENAMFGMPIDRIEQLCL